MMGGGSDSKKVITDINQLKSHGQIKNGFVEDLRGYLMNKYGTQASFTIDNEYKAKVQKSENGAAFSRVRKDPTEPKEVYGFCFRKDLCSDFPFPFHREGDLVKEKEEDLIEDIAEYAEKQEVVEEVEINESCMEDSSPTLNLTIDDKKYWARGHIGKGLEGEISVYIEERPFSDY